ncbi:MAG: SGNH/GDSL hydrolase family protein [Clostridia bacterium]|nr:SGNH/GDSL hydrolase family protein [Clostridia bacterium]
MKNNIRRVLSVLLCVMLLLGTAPAVFADEVPLPEAETAQEIQADYEEQAAEGSDEEALNYVLLGDSIARGSGVVNYEEACYGRIIADTNGYDYVNYGVDGMQSSELLELMKRRDVMDSIEEADIVNISIGGNNFLYGNIPMLILGVLFHIDSILDTVLDPYYEDLCEILGKIHEANPDAVILLQTLYNPSTGLLRPLLQYGSDKLNERIYQYDKEHPGVIRIVDVASKLNGKGYCFAFIHPTARGNVEIAKILLKVLYDLGLGKSTEPVIKVRGINTIELIPAYIFNPLKLIPFI